ncbi:MAG: hypothetical protein K6G33_12535 [Ruminococcus sp.]|uniref:hypothetical protein n=1 Tax=Ruminococcus sp. TaxID=41978 RepID=UPI0025DCA6DC|nr:hypothetical protein [Ruminococcus sp.]MCR5601556.1 hypothetical protein [Ruminococcus sp.]
MDITKKEYELLKKFKRAEYLIISDDITDILLDKGLIAHKTSKVNRDGSTTESPELVITNNGMIAYEKYYEEHREMRRTSFHAWAALIISLLALAVSATDIILRLV